MNDTLKIELFHRIADSESAAVRKEILRLGLSERVRFRNVDRAPKVQQELVALVGHDVVPVVRIGDQLSVGASEILPLLGRLASSSKT